MNRPAISDSNGGLIYVGPDVELSDEQIAAWLDTEEKDDEEGGQ